MPPKANTLLPDLEGVTRKDVLKLARKNNVRFLRLQFTDIVGRHFKQPKEGLGNDNSPVAHMWRTLANPDAPL